MKEDPYVGSVYSLQMSTIEYRAYRHYFESHGFLFKILVQMRPLSTDGAI